VVWTDARGNPLKRWDFSGQLPLVNGIKAWAVPGPCPPEALVLAGSEVSVNPADLFLWKSGRAVSIPVFPATYGLNVAVHSESSGPVVAAAPGPLKGYPRWVRIFSLDDPVHAMLEDFVVPGPEPAAGGTVALVDLDGDGVSEIVLGEGSVAGSPPKIRVVDRQRQVLNAWEIALGQ
jgi:hypothetical protein